MWNVIKRLQARSFLDVSSPRLLPLMALGLKPGLRADLINPDKKDLPATVTMAKYFGVADRCTFHSNLIQEAVLKPNSFDLITSMSVIEHISDDKEAVSKMWSLLKPGGTLLISVPCAAKASAEYTNLNDYELINPDDNGFVFWQRYYDEELIRQNIFSITGIPTHLKIYAEKKAGTYHLNVMQKRSDPFYPYWQEPFMMGRLYQCSGHLSDLPGMGVIAMEFIKPAE